jgi:hypothetical protein
MSKSLFGLRQSAATRFYGEFQGICKIGDARVSPKGRREVKSIDIDSRKMVTKKPIALIQ